MRHRRSKFQIQEEWLAAPPEEIKGLAAKYKDPTGRPGPSLLCSVEPMAPENIVTVVRALGLYIGLPILNSAEIDELLVALGDINEPGQRGVLRIPVVARFARSPRVVDLVRPNLSGEPRPVRAVYFDKTIDTNWSVSWHQDLTVAVSARADVRGFGPWSVKDGVPHVQAPAELLEQMITVRLHLDDCDESNGALRVLMGSHRFGKIPAEQISELVKECPEQICKAKAGHALLMRPLLLHSSSRSKAIGRRRVLHIEYAGFELPEPLAWAE